MSKPGSRNSINERLNYRGIIFSVLRTTMLDAPPEFRWTIYPAPKPSVGAASGLVNGPKAFARAYREAQVAIDQWLAEHPGDGGQ